MPVRIGKMEGAGPYYGIPLDELGDMDWSREEEVEIERHCEKILKNIAEEEMTPMERFKATFEGKERDRLLVECWFYPVYATRILDSWADSLKPIDLYRYPKLVVKSHLTTVARYQLDVMTISPITYGEEIWGANARLIEYGNPVVEGEMPIKSVEDLEGLEVADPKKHGLFPQYLWAIREMKRIFAKYGLDKVMPINGSFCTGPHDTVSMQMMGYTEFVKASRKDSELCKRCVALASEWSIRFGKAIIEVGVDYSYMCSTIGLSPVKGMEWVADENARIGKAVAPLGIPITHAWGLNGCLEWLPVMWEKGALGPDSFCGSVFTGDIEYKPAYDFCLEHDLYASCCTSDKLLVEGPVSLIEEEVKKRCDAAKGRPKTRCTAGIGIVDYFTPPAYLDAAIEAAKKHGKF